MRQPLYATRNSRCRSRAAALLGASSYNRMAVARALAGVTSRRLSRLVKARSSVQIERHQLLLRENLRSTNRLFDNGKINRRPGLRAKAELLAVEQQQPAGTENLATQARALLTSC